MFIYICLNNDVQITSVGGVKVSMVAFQAVDPGSIPGRRTSFLFFLSFSFYTPSNIVHSDFTC